MVKREHGHVVTIASAAGLVGVAKQTDYSGHTEHPVAADDCAPWRVSAAPRCGTLAG